MFDQNVDNLAALYHDLPYTQTAEARTGTYSADGVSIDPDPTVGLDAPYIWVRPNNGRFAVPALIGAIRSDLTNMRVEIGYNRSGELVAIRPIVDNENGRTYGAQLPSLGIPSTPIENSNDPLPYRLLEGGRLLPSASGGLTVYVEAYLPGGLITPELAYDISALTPGGANESLWVKFYIDTAGDVQTLTTTPTVFSLLETDAQALVIPAGSTPLGAVGLSNAQTEINWVLYVDLRIHHAPTLPDSAEIAYTPTTPGDYYEGAPGDTAEALDTLAARRGTLSVDATPVGNVSTGAQDLQTYTVAAGTLAADGDRLRGRAALALAISAGEEATLVFGSTTLFDSGALALAATAVILIDYEITRTGSSTQVYWITWTSTAVGLDSGGAFGSASEDLTAALDLKTTADATVTDDVISNYLTAELVHAP